jgi:ubiquinone biosynthesis protein UbiJ
MISAGAALALNHLLQHDATARARLAPHAGARIAFRTPPLPAAIVTILPDGLVSAGAAGADDAGEVPAIAVTFTPFALPLLAAGHPDAARHAAVTGPEPLAGLVRELVPALRWDIEEDLSRVVGDVVAHRAVQTGRDLLAWQREAGERLARNFSEYWTEEHPLLARRLDVDALRAGVRSLEDGIARLEARLAALEARDTPPA